MREAPYLILIVDDSPEDREIYRHWIGGGAEYQFVEAGLGEEGLRRCRSTEIDCVLLDYNLPDLDGLEFLARLERELGGRRPPVIMLTGRGSERIAVEAMKRGAEDYLVKESADQLLQATVGAAIDRAALRRRIEEQREELERSAEERARLIEELQASQAQYQDLYEHAPDMYFSVDAASSLVLQCNQTLADALGRNKEQIVGRSVLELYHPDSVRAAQSAFRQWSQSGEVSNAELVLQRSDGSAIDVVLNVSAVRDQQGKILYSRSSLHDISERKQMEEALKDADRRKDEFLAMLAHELRNPLAPIRNAVEILKLPASGQERCGWARDVIERQVQHLSRLVDDLLEVSRITTGRVELHRAPTEMATVISHAIETARPLIDQRAHELIIELPPDPLIVNGDPTRLAQVIGNLLGNSAKYTEPRGRIVLRAERANNQAVIRVRDNGIGIPAELLPRVFDLFMQADGSLDRSQGGLGIGLTLARILAEMHGGQLEAFSAGAGQGSEFVLTLPLMRESHASARQPNENNGQSAGRRILVVDDNKDVADSTALLLQLLGHAVRVSYDGPSALAAVPEFQPDLVLLDIGLPGMDGFEVVQHLRKLERHKRALRVIAITGYGQEEDRRRSLTCGFDHHLVKPVDPEELQRLIRS